MIPLNGGSLRAEPGLSNSLLHPRPRTEPVRTEPMLKDCLLGAVMMLFHSFEFLVITLL